MKNRYHQNRELLSAFLDDMLSEGRKQKVKEHLNSCAECREILRELEAVRQLLREYPLKDPGVGFQTAIFNRVEKERKPLALRTWSRRVSFGLGGMALILLTFFLLHEPYLPVPTIEPEKVVTQPQAGKIDKVGEKKVPAPEKIPGLPAAEKEKLKGISGGPAAPSVEKPFSADQSLREGEVAAPAKEEKTHGVKSIKVGGDITIRGIYRKPASTPNAPETAAASQVMADSVIVSVTSPQNTIIHTDEEWTRLWSIQNTAQNLSLPLPQINFNNQMVIAVPTRQDHREYQIVKTEDKTDKIVVQYREIVVSQDEKNVPLPYQLEIVTNRPSVEFQRVN